MSHEKSSSAEWSKIFETNVIDHLDIMFTASLRLTRNRADAQDLLQESVVRALRFHYKFAEGTHLRAWLLTIVRNTFINEYRKRARRPLMVESDGVEQSPMTDPDPDMGYYPSELRAKNVLELLSDDVRLAVEALPEIHKRTVIMADLQDMSYQDIADELGCPLGTVMSRLHRARRVLRDSLGKYAARVQIAYS